MTSEKRLFKRYAFSKDSNIRATLIPVVGEGAVEVKILNVSQGGIGLAAEKSINGALEVETELLVQNITGAERLPCLNGQVVRVKWILDYEPLKNLGLGCEFVNLQEECVGELIALFKETDWPDEPA